MGAQSVITRVVMVYCPDWAASIMAEQPDQPVAVMVRHRVFSSNAAARDMGIVVGLRRREAQRRCPHVRLYERDQDHEVRTFEPVLSALDDITPRVEILEPAKVVFPVRAPSRYFGGEDALIEKVEEVLGELVDSGVGISIADSLLAAEIAARQSLHAVLDRETSGCIVPSGANAEFLAPFPISVLRCGELGDLLHRLGIDTLGVFAALLAKDVVGRFGDDGYQHYLRACGFDTQPLHLGDIPVDCGVSYEPEEPITRVDEAAFVAKQLADRLLDELEARGAATTSIIVGATSTNGQVRQRCWRQEGGFSAKGIAQRVRWQLDAWLTAVQLGKEAGSELSKLELLPENIVNQGGNQLNLWGGAVRNDERARIGFARVQTLMGENSVQAPEFRGGRSHIDHYQLVPIDTVEEMAGELGGHRNELRAGTPQTNDSLPPWPGGVVGFPPTVVLPRARPIDVVDRLGERVEIHGRGYLSAAPVELVLPGTYGGGQRYRHVLQWAGPWIHEERWWDAVGHIRRARLQLVLEDNEIHLVFLEAQRWFLEATYD